MTANRLSTLTPRDLEGFNQGIDARAYEKLGAHEVDGGIAFAVWAPEAEQVSVIGDFNEWRHDAAPLTRLGATGVWHGVVQGAKLGSVYKYRIVSKYEGRVSEKADPYGFLHEMPPKTASIVARGTSDAFAWNDDEWMTSRKKWQTLESPISIYEVH